MGGWEYKWSETEPPFRVWRFDSFPSDHRTLTWGNLKDVLEGLWLYLVEGGHNRQVHFRIERRVEGILEVLGFGGLERSRE